jgi:hypothetical protein
VLIGVTHRIPHKEEDQGTEDHEVDEEAHRLTPTTHRAPMPAIASKSSAQKG